ncbi:unnamed protein product [Onchocerca flexuosa]|uniref:Uncharacterized protein n=1 Tax=Onchocerca flexuosa TaxID=387005 RepID=A0A183HJZ5_9BILA|nr:unnamed protein product [Onchocerca flexuosa]
MPSRRRLNIKERVTEIENHSIRSVPLLSAPKILDKTSHLVGNLINEEGETPFAVPSSQNINKSLNGHSRKKVIDHPHIIDFPKGGMDVKINTQNVAIVNDDRLKEQYQEDNVRIPEQSNHQLSRMKNGESPLLEVEKEHFLNDSFQEIEKQTNRVHIESEELLEELLEEVEPVVELEKRILKTIRPDATIIESQVSSIFFLFVLFTEISCILWKSLSILFKYRIIISEN